MGKQWLTLFFWAPKSLQMVIAAMKFKRSLLLRRKAMTNLDSILKSRDIILSTKVRLVKAMVFPVVMYGCESSTIKKAELPKTWCFWTTVLEKTRESLGLQGDQIRFPKGNQSWIFIGRTDVEAETPILWLPDTKNWLLGKDPDAGKSLKAGREGDNRGWDGWMASLMWWTWIWVGVGDGQGGLACCSPRGCKESDMTEQLNWNEPS